MSVGRAIHDVLAERYYQDMHAARKRGPVWSVTDIGELAARLGSIVTFDRRGDVYWLDGFENGVAKWLLDFNGTGGAATADTAYPRNGANNVQLIGGSDGQRYARARHFLPYPGEGKWGIEFSFACDNRVEFTDLQILFHDGTTTTLGGIRYAWFTNTVSYQSGAAAWTQLASSINLGSLWYIMHTMKLVVDFENSIYIRSMLNDNSWTMDTLSLPSYANVFGPALEIAIWNYSQSGYNGIMRIDDVIVTRNEPANP